MSMCPFFAYKNAAVALASTSDANAMPIAVYASIPKKVMSIGDMIAAAETPARPVKMPAAMPAMR